MAVCDTLALSELLLMLISVRLVLMLLIIYWAPVGKILLSVSLMLSTVEFLRYSPKAFAWSFPIDLKFKLISLLFPL
jgi:hypothetical protein